MPARVRIRIARSNDHVQLQPKTFLGKVLAYTAAAVILVAAFVFSLVLVAIVAAGGLLLVGYLWWKTRKLRKHLRENPPGGRVIEGEVVQDVEPRNTVER